MPPQLKTLIPLFVIFITLFIIIRNFLVPESFGEAGHYRFNSIQENIEKPLYYAGKEICVMCHDDKAEEMKSDLHAGISCESCHGPGMAHQESPEPSNISMPRGRAFCGRCHDFNFTRQGKIAQVDLDEHNTDNNCIECHNPHLPWNLNE